MVDWNKIVKLQSIKMLRTVSHNWWGIDIQFVNEQGNGKIKNYPLRNCFCQLMRSTECGMINCRKSFKQHMNGYKKSGRAFIFMCHNGLYGAAIPIFKMERHIGFIVGTGIYSLKNATMKNAHINELSNLGFDKTKIEETFKKLKCINGHSEEYILKFMELTARDVTAFCETLNENKNLNLGQAILQEKVYNKKYSEIIGTGPAVKKVFDTLELIEKSDCPVLIEGESGTGKELFAAAIHYNSSRRNKIFAAHNCSTFSETLFSSELFGHKKGSFTNAVSNKKGLLEIADGGTLFLDEISEMDVELQAKLLRVLEDGTFYSMGDVEQKKIDIRVIAATNKKLKERVEKGLFREDLFYRINTMHIEVPPLRDRKEDIVLLVNHFMESYAKYHDTEKKDINQNVFEKLWNYKWPGNIRELENLVERMIILSGREKTIETRHLPIEIAEAHYSGPYVSDRRKTSKLRNAVNAFERDIIIKALNKTAWNRYLAADELGISRTSLNEKINKLDIQPDS